MIIGIPKEIKKEELRVAITPAGVSAFVAHGHKVLIEKAAGVGSGLLDKGYRKAGATIINDTHGVVHYCVANMPGAVPRTSTCALTNSTLSYALALADQGLELSMGSNKALKNSPSEKQLADPPIRLFVSNERC